MTAHDTPRYEDLLAHLDDYEALRKAARVVIERWDKDELRNRHIDALRAALVAIGAAFAGYVLSRAGESEK